jgi:hypothetical protein
MVLIALSITTEEKIRVFTHFQSQDIEYIKQNSLKKLKSSTDFTHVLTIGRPKTFVWQGMWILGKLYLAIMTIK